MELTWQWHMVGGSYYAKKKMYMLDGDKYCEKHVAEKGNEG